MFRLQKSGLRSIKKCLLLAGICITQCVFCWNRFDQDPANLARSLFKAAGMNYELVFELERIWSKIEETSHNTIKTEEYQEIRRELKQWDQTFLLRVKTPLQNVYRHVDNLVRPALRQNQVDIQLYRQQELKKLRELQEVQVQIQALRNWVSLCLSPARKDNLLDTFFFYLGNKKSKRYLSCKEKTASSTTMIILLYLTDLQARFIATLTALEDYAVQSTDKQLLKDTDRKEMASYHDSLQGVYR